MTPPPFLCVLLLSSSLLFSCATTRNLTPSLEWKEKEAQYPLTDTLLLNLLGRHPQYFSEALKNKDAWRIQIIYTQVDRDARNRPRFQNHYFNVRPGNYFYPASAVKMPAAVLALYKLNELNIPGLNRGATMITEKSGDGETAVYSDPTSPDARPTIAQYIKKIFLVSSNDAYNRLYEFLGQEYLNTALQKMGYDSVQLLHRLQVSLTEEQNRRTNPIKFFDTTGRLLFQQKAVQSNLIYHPRQHYLGTGFMQDGKLVNGPFDFSKKNLFTLPDLHSILQSIMFPEAIPANQRFHLKEENYRFLWRCMSMKPSESAIPQYVSFSDASGKLLLFGGEGKMGPAIRIFNKLGGAYGFLTDVAYVVDFEKGVEFFLSATIYCNSDGVFNDDKYDYASIGNPFLMHLGQVIYQYEVYRTKERNPDLSKFQLDYSNVE